jgi:hypothetical protein
MVKILFRRAGKKTFGTFKRRLKLARARQSHRQSGQAYPVVGMGSRVVIGGELRQSSWQPRRPLFQLRGASRRLRQPSSVQFIARRFEPTLFDA